MEEPKFIKKDALIHTPEEMHEQYFAVKHLAILRNGYGSFIIGIQDYYLNRVGKELPLVEIDNLPEPSRNNNYSNGSILEVIIQSLPEARTNFKKFKSAVEEAVEVLFAGKAKVSFPNEKYIDYAIECMEEDSMESAEIEGKETLAAVESLFLKN